jgi:hypothetical protein
LSCVREIEEMKIAKSDSCKVAVVKRGCPESKLGGLFAKGGKCDSIGV